MKGTAILFQELNITFIEDVEHSVFEEIKDQCGCDNCNCKLDNKIVNFGSVLLFSGMKMKWIGTMVINLTILLLL